MDSKNPIGENKHTPHAQGKSHKESDHTEQPIASTATETKSKPTQAHHESACNPEKDWWDKTKHFVEILGIILLAIYTGYTIKMYYVNKEAANAATSAAQAAHDALIDAQNSFANQQRAWLGIGPYEPEKHLIEKGAGINIKIRLNNSGKTPALQIRTGANVIFTPATLTHPPASNWTTNFHFEPMGIIPPEGGANWHVPISWEQWKPDFSGLMKGDRRIFILGLVEYRDTFGEKRPVHTTRVCLYLDPFRHFMNFCDAYNDMD